jgi:hypothetical protein
MYLNNVIYLDMNVCIVHYIKGAWDMESPTRLGNYQKYRQYNAWPQLDKETNNGSQNTTEKTKIEQHEPH